MVIFFPEKIARKCQKIERISLAWRTIKSKDDIFPPEENEDNEKLAKATKAAVAKEAVPMKIRKLWITIRKN
jgi:hypothetical protein